MARQSISFTEPNNEWLNRQVDWTKSKLEMAEKGGFTEDSKADILKQSKDLLKG